MSNAANSAKPPKIRAKGGLIGAFATAADLVLALDADGRILFAAVEEPELAELAPARWVGSTLGEAATPDSAMKIGDMLTEARERGVSRWRQISHQAPGAVGAESTPLLYRILRIADPEEPRAAFVAIGRNQSGLVEAQRRLIAAHQDLEQEYAEVQAREARFRHVFQVSGEPMLILDKAGRILAANDAACQLAGAVSQRLVGRMAAEALDAEADDAARGLAAQASARPGVAVRLVTRWRGRAYEAVATSFRQGGDAQVLLRLAAPPDGDAAMIGSGGADVAAAAIGGSPDAFVALDARGDIRFVNAAFMELAETADAAQLVGEPMERFLGRTPVDAGVLLRSLVERGALRPMPAGFRSAGGWVGEVEIAACALPEAAPAAYAFFVRAARRTAATPAPTAANEPTLLAIDQMTQLVGRVPLKALVRQTTDVIERMCIEAALRLSGGNRASAAEMLGLSRQSLYVKLRKYELIDAGDIGEELTDDAAE